MQHTYKHKFDRCYLQYVSGTMLVFFFFFFTRMPNGFSPCQERDEARHQPAVFRELWSQKVDSAGESGKIRRWKHFLTCSAVRSLNSPGLRTSAVHFHLDQRAQPQFQACKHGETSAAGSMIFPLRIFQVDVLKQTLACFWPHLWLLELWPLCVHMCPVLRT